MEYRFCDIRPGPATRSLAFFFGYLLTSLPLLRAGLALGAVIPIALASDTASIAIIVVAGMSRFPCTGR